MLSGNPSLDVNCFLAGEPRGEGELSSKPNCAMATRSSRKQTQTIDRPAAASQARAALDPYTDAPVYATTETLNDPARHTVTLCSPRQHQLWDLAQPHLYTVHVRLLQCGRVIDEDTRRVGFREADLHRPRLLA